LKYIVNRVREKKILVEKPLFNKVQKIETFNNDVFVAYNLRFHPLIEDLRKIIAKEKVLLFNAIAGQYLPFWRENLDYRESYSASYAKGGVF
jgi:CMP-N,N'-diacetyllegionaminic acid synthase